MCMNSDNFFLYVCGMCGRVLIGLLHGSLTGHALTLYALCQCIASSFFWRLGEWEGQVLDEKCTCTGSRFDMFSCIILKKVMQDRQISLTVRVLHLSAFIWYSIVGVRAWPFN